MLPGSRPSSRALATSRNSSRPISAPDPSGSPSSAMGALDDGVADRTLEDFDLTRQPGRHRDGRPGYGQSQRAPAARRRGPAARVGRSDGFQLSESAPRFGPWSPVPIFPRDPHFAVKAARVLDFYQRIRDEAELGDGEYVISTDEKSQLQVLYRCHPGLRIAPFTALLDQVMSAEPYASARPVFWAADNGSSHQAGCAPR
jgi:hypothetical protein